ncbi:MAG TPA: hypothetical protein VFQ84_01870 [Arenimonas sp.]|uniref:hypothetical protein n=1 Tax=Arenimonas sp. TaxID=1872635 RepID=UPI002D7F1072|nr:hypothetical protein [Arenimonas sp.]HEU0152071.1 hypothetical protein [Arenimonas sp.]
MNPLLRSAIAGLLALSGAVAFAQSPAPLVVPDQDDGTTALPIIRNNQVEGFLLIESGATAANPARNSLDRLLGRNATPSLGAGMTFPLANGRRVGTNLSLETNPTVGLLCNGNAVSRSFGALAQHCMVANLAPNPTAPLALARPGVRMETRLEGNDGALSASLGLNRFSLQSPLALPGTAALDDGSESPLMLSLRSADYQQEDIGLLGELKIGESGWVSIGGTLARARIVPAAQLPGGLPPEWNTGTLTISGGVGNFGGEVIGRVIELPGTNTRYSDMGVGVTWRAPWRGRLSLGAANLAPSGQNPFSAADEDNEETRVPYIRYEQDL